jgi:hypothetical protein
MDIRPLLLTIASIQQLLFHHRGTETPQFDKLFRTVILEHNVVLMRRLRMPNEAEQHTNPQPS